MPEFRNNLRARRQERDNMTQEELAQLADVSRQTIIAIETGKYTPSLGLAFRLAKIFKCRVEELFILDK